MNESSCEEIESLLAVLSVANIGSLDPNHLEHRLEHWCADEGTSWQTNNDDCSPRSDVFGGLLEGLLVDSHQDDCVRTKPVIGGSSNVLGDVA